ncbi:MAG: BREX-1 system adenine-specific DNA-methyltransferase PglX [Candidatus Thiodiazotropha sp. 6PLUC9]
METAKLKKFAQFARRSLIEQVSNRLKLVLAKDSVARRESAEAVKKLEEQIKAHDKEQVIEKVAYIWFNRFCALRFMDVNRYTRIGVLSPAEGQFQPEILAEAKMGHIDEDMVQDQARQQIFALLDGKAPSSDPQGEAYRLLVVATCNFWNKAMPFLFQRIEDYTELLMPDDLLSGNSILAYTRETMTPDTCEDVEVIGWLYQFYISEKKDEVFDGLKKNKKITPENIPAATQLFTPHWIVRYLVENSLGRLWMLNRSGSKLVGQMDYYIKPEQAETDFVRISKPEEIKICDPACGSGHMLTYAFDLLYAIYEEEGYEPAEIPEKILTHNLYGIEIDERAGELAAFALTMKARAKQRRFFNKGVKPNICVLENVSFHEDELREYMDFIGRDLFTAPLQTTLRQFEEADNFGSLIRPDVTDVDGMLRILESKNVSGHLFLSMTHQKVLQALWQADYLSPKYHVVIANPPYMGSKGMNGRLGAWAKENYPNSKSDLFAMFIERNLDLAQEQGAVAMITMQSWMFLSSFEAVRGRILTHYTLVSMAHLGTRAFDSIGGEVVSTTAFVLENRFSPNHKGTFLRLVDGKSEAEKARAIITAIKDPGCGWFFRVAANDIAKIPGYPIAYWANENAFSAFAREKPISSLTTLHRGISTGNNDIFARLWFEVSRRTLNAEAADRQMAENSGARWFPYNRGGTFRKWYGLGVDIIDYEGGGQRMIAAAERGDSPGFRHDGSSEYFRETITWTALTAGKPSFRLLSDGYVLGHKGSSIKSSAKDRLSLLGLFNSNVLERFLEYLSPTLDINIAQISALPLPQYFDSRHVSEVASTLVEVSREDWDSFETSWDFTRLPLLNTDSRQTTLENTYQQLRDHWQEMTVEMQRLEEENNRIFIEAYGLQDELTPEVPLSEITLTCNPHYRYGNDKSEEELEALLMADTMRELVSYAVGCMFGRYALDEPGLILANQGETIDDYLKQIPESCFPADDDNVIPMLDGDWFTDDIAERFRKFLRVTFGEAHYEENLQFVEQALNIKGKRNYSIRDYFLGEFYTDHVKRYKKRPIYWLFSSSKGSFNALIYMHRYRPDTVSVVLNDYLREFRTKLTARKNHLEAVSVSASASQGEKTKALKEIDKLNRMIQEMEEYERDVLYPLATEQVEIDLDDGVKVNYIKFDAALKKITGLSGK